MASGACALAVLLRLAAVSRTTLTSTNVITWRKQARSRAFLQCLVDHLDHLGIAAGAKLAARHINGGEQAPHQSLTPPAQRSALTASPTKALPVLTPRAMALLPSVLAAACGTVA